MKTGAVFMAGMGKGLGSWTRRRRAKLASVDAHGDHHTHPEAGTKPGVAPVLRLTGTAWKLIPKLWL
jgi:hypothetical protein